MLVRGLMRPGKGKLHLRPKMERVIEVNEQWKSRWQTWLGTNAPKALAPGKNRHAEILRLLLACENGYLGIGKFLDDNKLTESTLRTLRKKGLLGFAGSEV